MKNNEKHPCYNADAKGKYGRVHLPVAPKCNIQCNYCNRQYDCVNESRPGVTSTVLMPNQAIEYLKALRKNHPELTVAGIAGPGDPFATAELTLGTLELLHKAIPDMIPCLSTNGLELYAYIPRLKELNVDHVTITVNSLDVNVLAQIYSWVRFEKRIFRGKEGASILIEQQLKCIEALANAGITTKVNTILIPGVNDNGIIDLAKKVSALGASLMNVIPMIPVEGTPFESIAEPSKPEIKALRNEIGKYIKPMTHCARCRADAAGLLGKDIDESHMLIREFSVKPGGDKTNRPYTAVATNEGLLVNQHLGEAESVYIFTETSSGYKFIETRKTPEKGLGTERWLQLTSLLSDCRAILVAGVGSTPYKFITQSGVEVIEMAGLIDEGLDAVYKDKELKCIKKRDMFKCGSSCSGTATGCG